jgi:hypothetical protein
MVMVVMCAWEKHPPTIYDVITVGTVIIDERILIKVFLNRV